MSTIKDLILEEQYKRWQKLKNSHVILEQPRDFDAELTQLGKDVRARSGAPEPKQRTDKPDGRNEVQIQLKNVKDTIDKMFQEDLGAFEDDVFMTIASELHLLGEKALALGRRAKKNLKISSDDTVVTEPTKVTRSMKT